MSSTAGIPAAPKISDPRAKAIRKIKPTSFLDLHTELRQQIFLYVYDPEILTATWGYRAKEYFRCQQLYVSKRITGFAKNLRQALPEIKNEVDFVERKWREFPLPSL